MTNILCNIIIATNSLALANIFYFLTRIIDRHEGWIAAEVRDTARDNIEGFNY